MELKAKCILVQNTLETLVSFFCFVCFYITDVFHELSKDEPRR